MKIKMFKMTNIIDSKGNLNYSPFWVEFNNIEELDEYLKFQKSLKNSENCFPGEVEDLDSDLEDSDGDYSIWDDPEGFEEALAAWEASWIDGPQP